MMDLDAVYVLWLRETIRFFRAKSRVIGTLATPVFFLLGMGFGLNSLVHIGNTSYINYLVPGILGMSLLFTSTASGMSVMWDREFGFLKEIMVTPNSRVAVVLGRTAGNATTAIIQSIIVALIASLMGFTFKVGPALPLALVFLVLIAVAFISIGLIFASMISDFQGFTLIMNLLTFPLLFLSNAIFPVSGLPKAVQYLSYINPLTYGVDGLRNAMSGTGSMPILLDLAVLSAWAVAMVLLSAYTFNRTDVK